MKQLIMIGIAIVSATLVLHSFAMAGQTGIVVNNADVILQPTLAKSTTFDSLATSVTARLAGEYEDANRNLALNPPANSFHTLLTQASLRVSFDFAQSSRVTTLQFPKTLVNDTTPPQVKGAISTQLGSNSATLLVSTSEFTIATVDYGTQPGSYSKSQSTTTFAKQHSLALSGVAANSVVFYKLTLTDLSGNLATTPEASFTATEKRSVYLPLISR